MRLIAIDWVIIVLACGLLLGVTIWTKRYVKGVADFTVAGRKVRVWLGLSASSADGIAIASVIAISQQSFESGFSYMWLFFLSMLICVPLIGIYGFGIKRYRATGVQTLPQYYEMRYSKGVRRVAGIAIAIGGVLNMAIFPMIAAEFLMVILGLPDKIVFMGSQFDTTLTFVIILLVPSVFFALLGGFVTVVVTNYVQAIIMAVAIFAVTWLALVKCGSSVKDVVDNIYATLNTNIGSGAFNLFQKNSYGPVWIVFFIASNIYGVLSFPPSLAMTSGAENPEVARKMYLVRTIFNNGRMLCLVLWGICAMVVIGMAVPAGMDKQDLSRVASAMLINKIVPPGLIGIVLIGLIFAETSTLSAYLLSWSTIIVNDVICSFREKPFTNQTHIRLLKMTVLSIAVFIFLWSIYYEQSESILTYQYLTGTIFTGAGIISFFGLYWKRTTTSAAYIALVICMVVPMADLFLKQHWHSIAFLSSYSESYPLRGEQSGLLAIVLAMIAIYAASIVSKDKTKFVNYGIGLK